MSRDFIDRDHEVHRSTLYLSTEETVPILINYVDVMRQMRTSVDNASEHTFNDYWNEESDVALSDERIGTTRFLISRTKLPKRYKGVDG